MNNTSTSASQAQLDAIKKYRLANNEFLGYLDRVVSEGSPLSREAFMSLVRKQDNLVNALRDLTRRTTYWLDSDAG